MLRFIQSLSIVYIFRHQFSRAKLKLQYPHRSKVGQLMSSSASQYSNSLSSALFVFVLKPISS